MNVHILEEAAEDITEDALVNRGIELNKQNIMIDQLTIKFGKSECSEKRIRSTHTTAELDNALRKALFAKSRSEVMKCLD